MSRIKVFTSTERLKIIEKMVSMVHKTTFQLILSNTDENIRTVLAGEAQWIEGQPVNQRVPSSIPSLGHMPGL